MEMAKDYTSKLVNPNLTIDDQSETLGNITTPFVTLCFPLER